MIIATGAGSEEIAVRAMKLGAADYINKETHEKFFRLLPSVIEKALRQHELERQKQRAETELRESEERLRSILASIDDAVLVTDRGGMFVAARAPGRRARPRSPPRRTGSAPRSATSSRPRWRRSSRRPLPRCRRTTASSSSTTRCPRRPPRSGSTPRCRPLKDVHGQFSGVTIVARDITARKQAEDQLRLATFAADAASRAKSDLLAGMSHELRTPLTAIIGYSEILFYEYFGTVNERQKQQLDIILQCSRHLLELINDILDISKIESGKTELDLGPVRIERAAGAHPRAPEGDRLAAEDPRRDPRADRELAGA